MPTMAIETNYAKFNWFPSGLPLYLNLVPAILQLIVVLSNIFVVVIFLRKKMYRGINVILIGMATADAACVFLLMVSYWFALVLHIHSSGSFSENQVHFLCVTYKYGTSVSITFNMVSIWLMVCLGVVKFLLVRFPLQAKYMMTTCRLLFTTLLVYVIAILFTFPHYVTDNYDMSAKIYYGKSKEQDIFYCAIRRKRDGDFVLYLENDDRLVRCICVHLIPHCCTPVYKFIFLLQTWKKEWHHQPFSKIHTICENRLRTNFYLFIVRNTIHSFLLSTVLHDGHREANQLPRNKLLVYNVYALLTAFPELSQ